MSDFNKVLASDDVYYNNMRVGSFLISPSQIDDLSPLMLASKAIDVYVQSKQCFEKYLSLFGGKTNE